MEDRIIDRNRKFDVEIVSSRIVKSIVAKGFDVSKSNVLIKDSLSGGDECFTSDIEQLCFELLSLGIDVYTFGKEGSTKVLIEESGNSIIEIVDNILEERFQREDHRLPKRKLSFNAIIVKSIDDDLYEIENEDLFANPCLIFDVHGLLIDQFK